MHPPELVVRCPTILMVSFNVKTKPNIIPSLLANPTHIRKYLIVFTPIPLITSEAEHFFHIFILLVVAFRLSSYCYWDLGNYFLPDL